MLDIKVDLKPHFQRRTTPYHPTEFGRLRSDHMFLMDYDEGNWHHPRIVPYGPLSLYPGAKILNYGQGIFEGQKAKEKAEEKAKEKAKEAEEEEERGGERRDRR